MKFRGILKIAGPSVLVAVLVAGIFSWPTDQEVGNPEPVASPAASSSRKIPDRETLPQPDARPEGPSPETGSEIADEELQEWLHRAGVDTPGTLSKVVEMPDGGKRRELLEWILAAWTSEDRTPALGWLKTSLSTLPAEPAREVLDLLAGGWALENPLDAMAWVTANLTDDWREAALKDVASSWAQADPDAMGEWIRAQPQPAPYWTGELIQALIPSRPAQAMEWCSRMEDPAVAAANRQNVIQSWLLLEPAGAEAWLKNHPEMVPEVLPEEPPP